ncbi:MAG: IS21 family transposase [Campylobacterota bacterium]|nr:IS21 family transposase [Campylobacterota bacterium]
MSKIKEVLRLTHLSKLSSRQVETLTGISQSTVLEYCSRFKQTTLSLEAFLEYDNEKVLSLLYPEALKRKTGTSRPHPDWSYIHNELKDKKKGMTRHLLWEEYKEQHPDGYGISQFKEYYSRFKKRLNPSMRQIHYAGDKLFVDFSGLTMPIHNARTGEVHKAQIFVAVLGASGYTFVHAVMSQSTEDFIECHNEAFSFYGGVPNQVVPDNLKAAVISHKKGVVRLNESYADMGRHYGVAIVPARPYKPQDKSKAELGVKGIQRWILMRLRNHTFFDINELNDAISQLIDAYNDKVIRRLNKSRTELFAELDAPALHPLRANRYVYREHKQYTVRSDYHIEIDGSGYSVPFEYLGKRVDVWYSRHSVSISHQSEVIATHPRLSQPYEDSTITEHMPKKYQYQFEKWNPGRILNWALSIGENTTALMKQIMDSRSHVVRGYQSCMAILSFSKTYGNDALEKACAKALEINTQSVGSIESMLKRKTYLQEETACAVNNLFNSHENIRGGDNYK